MTRRTVIGSLLATNARAQRPATWRPRLGILARYSEANIRFAKAEGFRGIGLWAQPKTRLDANTVTDAALEKIQADLAGLHLSVIGQTENHIAPDPEARARSNAYFARVIEIAGRLGAPCVGATSGTMPGRPLDEQVAEIVRVYTEKYFPL